VTLVVEGVMAHIGIPRQEASLDSGTPGGVRGDLALSEDQSPPRLHCTPLLPAFWIK